MTTIAARLLIAIAGACAGGMFTYCLKAVHIEGRLDGVERALIRIENRLEHRP